jgi:hypothetical protein
MKTGEAFDEACCFRICAKGDSNSICPLKCSATVAWRLRSRRVGRAGTGVRLINVAYGLHHDGKPIGYNSSSNWIAPRIHHKLTAMPLDILVRNVVLWGTTGLCDIGISGGPQPRPTPTARALPPKSAEQGGHNWKPASQSGVSGNRVIWLEQEQTIQSRHSVTTDIFASARREAGCLASMKSRRPARLRCHEIRPLKPALLDFAMTISSQRPARCCGAGRLPRRSDWYRPACR